MKRKNMTGIIFFLCVAVLFTAGCAGLKKSKATGSSRVLEPQETARFSDIPVPSGFKPVIEDTYSFENAGVRVAVLKYQGKVDINRVIDFYKEQMLMYDWNLLNVIEYGQVVMNFDRSNETCIVNLTPKGKNVLITVSLGPKSQSYKKSKEPVK